MFSNVLAYGWWVLHDSLLTIITPGPQFNLCLATKWKLQAMVVPVIVKQTENILQFYKNEIDNVSAFRNLWQISYKVYNTGALKHTQNLYQILHRGMVLSVMD